MPISLLPEAFIAVLKLDRTAALAAAFLIGNHHADILLFAARIVGGDAAKLDPPSRKPKAAARRRRKANGHGGGVSDAYLERRRSRRDADDSALLEAMRASPGATIGDWSEAIHKSRTSTIAGLKRLRDRNLASNEDGVWALVEPPREPPAKWIAPLSVREHRAHAVA